MKNIEILCCNNYLPFNLYLTIVYNILIKMNYNMYIINNIYEHNDSANFLIMFINDIELSYIKYFNFTKVILINADYLLNQSIECQQKIKKFIEGIKEENIFIWEYNPLNFKLYDEFKIFKKIFIPLEYSPILEEIYNQNKIPYSKKDIDILFLGNPNKRRLEILDKLRKKYKVEIHTFINDINYYCSLVERSKIILNIYTTEINMPFDYYRLALLYSNKIFVITEIPIHMDTLYQKNIIKLNKNIITSTYDNIENTIDYYLKQDAESINNITRKIYNVFKKTNMEKNIINFFNKIA